MSSSHHELQSRAARTDFGSRGVAAAVSLIIALTGASGCSRKAAATEGAAGGAPTALPAAGRTVQVCSDAAGDGGDADLLSITSAYEEQRVFVAFAFATPLPAGVATLVLQSSAAHRQIRIVLRDAQPATVEMATEDSAATAAQPEEVVHVAGADVHVVLPAMMMPADTDDWTAVMAAGSVRDVCSPGR